MSLGITMGDSSYRVEVPVNSIAATIARTYQSSKKQEAGSLSAEDDFSRMLYNVKQIAFNVSTVAAAVFGTFAAVGIFSLTTGIVFTTLFWVLRSLVIQDIRKTLEASNGEEGSKESNFAILNDKETIQNYVNRFRESKISLAESWKAGFDLRGVFLWRSLIPLHVNGEVVSPNEIGTN